MNERTKDELIKFINKVQILAQGVVHLTGTDDCAKLLDAGERLKQALESDETII